MKALHVITGLGVGGAEQQLRLLLRHLPAQCDVVTLTNPGSVAAGLAADGVRVAHLGMSGNRDVDALPRLTRLIRAGRYDLVHTHLYRACLYGRIAARLAGVRTVVATEHSIGTSRLEGRPLTSGVRALYLAGERLGRATVAVSPTVAQRLRHWGVPGPRIRVIPNGVDAPRFRFDEGRRSQARAFHGLPADAYVVGGVGRLTPGKRFDVLVRALHQLPGDVRLLLVGAGPEEAALRRTAQRLGRAGPERPQARRHQRTRGFAFRRAPDPAAGAPRGQAHPARAARHGARHRAREETGRGLRHLGAGAARTRVCRIPRPTAVTDR